ncbi:tail-specific protease precursor [Saccharicrinis fermentans DSM 9555 = JCM 21142]|uniref:Tail-specific protease n=1 Tax=Saccharicrinis fermentans DSM 9555 = JCM 21142 TaxID=869213 RepID=W7XY10_9BACT|nr:tail-specific protease precursor [Saccharicrinis fermentans DSM 9555 = JCM 21142]
MRLIAFFVFGSLLLMACEDTDNDTDIDPELLLVNNFIYDNMNNYYLWNTKMPILDPNTQSDSEDFFNKLLYEKIDKWSFITDDVDELNNYFDGVRVEMGYSLQGYYLEEGSDRVVAFVEYVEPDGPADKAGLKRGDLIVAINGGWITEDNYADLFYDEQLNVGLGTIENGIVYDLNPTVNLVAEELNINPVLQTEVFDVDGVKIGYLAYTSFISKFDDHLEAVFSDFKNAGVSELILDLRYNGGGSVESAKLMASMICPASCVGKLFLRTAYNEALDEAIKNMYPDTYTEQFEDYFESNGNNLDLSNLYVLTTSGTASASEMVIYSLSPYMNVVQIGEQSHGKYYGSITIYDEEKKHSWAMQPIVMRAENVDNSIDYSVGLIPDYEMNDNYEYELGDSEEVLTSFAISLIKGSGTQTNKVLKSVQKNACIPSDVFKQMENPLKYQMYKNLLK